MVRGASAASFGGKMVKEREEGDKREFALKRRGVREKLRGGHKLSCLSRWCLRCDAAELDGPEL